jgi:hypothetical protein
LDDADAVVAGIGDVEELAEDGESLGRVELRRAAIAVLESGPEVAGEGDGGAVGGVYGDGARS